LAKKQRSSWLVSTEQSGICWRTPEDSRANKRDDLFDLYKSEEKTVRALVEDKMKTAIMLSVPIEVEFGVSKTWLEAH
jgi:hypothetical protein